MVTAESRSSLQKLVNKIIKYSNNREFEPYSNRTEAVVISNTVKCQSAISTEMEKKKTTNIAIEIQLI